MKNIIRPFFRIPLLILIATGIVSLAVSVTQAGNNRAELANNPQVFPPTSHAFGKSYSEWAEAWWKWAVSFPIDVNPVADSTGQNAALGQSGPVWFLAGNFGGTTVRQVTVPEGKALFFPILNTVYLGFPCDSRGLPGCESDQALEQANDVATLLSFINPSMDGATLACEVDGEPLGNLQAYRESSKAIFALTLPDNNVFTGIGLPAGPYHPCVDAGYYLLVKPLPVGRHAIHFHGENADGSFIVDVTYDLTIIKEHPHQG